ncbi:TatD family hydrolase [Patescibacteria group bacterium]|nr:TatD family hydrolase [Patescibacteria group bacterium]MBU1500649.1 TatD family hydrolase [Patescibacteria group bacterium]MBU2080398.1 TatD family hydrolase [Patescibacteria group bacterium]MBU2124190.1 TatD family hydrolase [Patescibacteria group bacterium]MBU2194359.1 TatD family hydrolase [Patescibacteria group bacterium]
MKYFDAHCHIQFDRFSEDRTEVIEKMQKEEFGGLVVGVDMASTRAAVELVQQYPHLWASVGLHPNDTPEEPFDREAFLRLAGDPKVVAIGECGLDNYRPEDPEQEKERQRRVFIQHVELALETDKPLMIHSRPKKGTMDAYHDLIEILGSYKKDYGEKLRGDIHFFVGGIEEAKAFVELGFTMSFTAVLTFARDYDEVVRYLPLESILSETDAPYVAPASRRGTRNDPFAVRDVVEAIAEIRGEDTEKVRSTILANAERVFGLSGL